MSKNFELLQQHDENHLFWTGSPPEASPPANPPQPARREGVAPREIPPLGHAALSLPIHLFHRMKEGARQWRRQAEARTQPAAPDVERIARKEEFRLVQNLFYSGNGSPPQVVLFYGVEAEAGCAAICARLGMALVNQLEGAVCVVDADFRSPRIHQWFGLQAHPGLRDALLHPETPIREFAQRVQDSPLWILPSGAAGSPLNAGLASERLPARMQELRSAFRRVVICSSPMELEASPTLLRRCVDGVVLVLEAHATRREAARRMQESLRAANVRLLGAVLNSRTFPIPEKLYRRL